VHARSNALNRAFLGAGPVPFLIIGGFRPVKRGVGDVGGLPADAFVFDGGSECTVVTVEAAVAGFHLGKNYFLEALNYLTQ